MNHLDRSHRAIVGAPVGRAELIGAAIFVAVGFLMDLHQYLAARAVMPAIAYVITCSHAPIGALRMQTAVSPGVWRASGHDAVDGSSTSRAA
jgi:hypothetical protein